MPITVHWVQVQVQRLVLRTLRSEASIAKCSCSALSRTRESKECCCSIVRNSKVCILDKWNLPVNLPVERQRGNYLVMIIYDNLCKGKGVTLSHALVTLPALFRIAGACTTVQVGLHNSTGIQQVNDDACLPEPWKSLTNVRLFNLKPVESDTGL